MKSHRGKQAARLAALLAPVVVLLTLAASAAQAVGVGGRVGPVSRLIVTQGNAWTGALPVAIVSVILGLLLLAVAWVVTTGWSAGRATLAVVPSSSDAQALRPATDDQESRRKAA